MEINPRSRWGALPPKGRVVALHSKGVVVHHTTGTTLGSDIQDDWLRNIQNYHFSKGWQDIAYNFLVDRYGRIWEGRGWGVQGAHCLGHNDEYLGIAYMGDDDISDVAKVAIDWLVGEAQRRTVGKEVIPHSKLGATSCPGPKITAWLKDGHPSPAKPAPAPTKKPRKLPTISLGSFNVPVVSKAQKALNSKKVWWKKGLKVDGHFGAKTKALVIDFQKRRGLTPDGIIGPKTWAELLG